tara:strand:- start:32 stop:1144 length:1113 start_codon:yes stop_codon:yes gene_type:complete
MRLIRNLLDDLCVTFPAWLVGRLLVGLSWLVANFITDNFQSSSEIVPRVNEGLMAWDGNWYRSLLVGGYDSVPLEGVRFFPGFVWLGRLFEVFLPGGPAVALVAVANLGALLAGIAIRRLVLAETTDYSMANRAVWLLACFPSSFVLVWGYAEGPFLAASITAVLALRYRYWGIAALLAVASSLLRPTGVLLIIPIAIAIISDGRIKSKVDALRKSAAVLGAPLGSAIFLWWASVHFDDLFVPYTIQREFRGSFVDPFSRLLTGLGDLFSSDSFDDGFHILFAVGFFCIAIQVLRSWPSRYGVYAVANLLVVVSCENLNSLERYGLGTFPLILGLSGIMNRPQLNWVLPVISAGGMVALSVLAWLGIYVP